ncbi:hypothetical protein H9Q13_05280 [Pontibacter sp. JH31]|uniref:DUF4136 domain-containing protein n=1 Tax=Pontibacter aquaedesilientis TaxID=2766980 RepID=A0ABR7XE55_9BACT|nr:hypothetical protein [Pontibacter aquaedesilientis]MBD1396570.1 hypothetical protein [Pontibacter aquaedesilientis]
MSKVYHKVVFCLSAAVLLCISSCASVNSKVYESSKLKSINNWIIDFAYETGSVEELQKSSGDYERKVINKGQSSSDLQLRDDLYYTLKDNYSIPMSKASTETTGIIQLHPIHFGDGGFQVLTVTLLDKKGETIARLKIKNGDRVATFKNNDKFARYAAEGIAKAIIQN